jgi:hypothetical protein
MATRTTLIVLTIAGLAADAIVHFNLASAFDGNKTSVLSEADIFRIDASVAIVAAVVLAIRPRRYTAAFAFLVAAAGTAAVVVYRYVDVGGVGPIPNMYDPYWQPIGKMLSAVAEAIATVTAFSLFVLLRRQASNPARDAFVRAQSAARSTG